MEKLTLRKIESRKYMLLQDIAELKQLVASIAEGEDPTFDQMVAGLTLVKKIRDQLPKIVKIMIKKANPEFSEFFEIIDQLLVTMTELQQLIARISEGEDLTIEQSLVAFKLTKKMMDQLPNSVKSKWKESDPEIFEVVDRGLEILNCSNCCLTEERFCDDHQLVIKRLKQFMMEREV